MIKNRITHILDNKILTKYKFCKDIGVSKSFLDKDGDISTEIYTKIIAYFPEISSDWLLTGRGEMLKNEEQNNFLAQKTNDINNGLPLVGINAVAGFGNSYFAISKADIKEYYTVPKFKYCKVDFMIEISGSSMYPKYNSGDVIACTILHERSFLQWNKCHILATREQGIICKRLCQSEKKGHIKAVSDNNNYPPFDIPEEEITGIALVVGVIKLE